MTQACLTGAGFGGVGVGTQPFGSSSPVTGVIVSAAEALTLNSIRVGYLGDPDLGTDPVPGPVVKPASWTLEPLDGGKARLVQLVEIESSTSLIIYFDGVLTEGAEYRVTLGTDNVIAECSAATFIALRLRKDARSLDARSDDGFLVDISNPFLTRDAVRFPPALGTYQITDTGDIALEKSGISSLRKRVFRRVITMAGGFFHLPNYGAGGSVKRMIKVDEAQRLSSRIQAQVLQEPEVVRARVIIGRVATQPNMLSVNIRVQTISGDPEQIVVPISIP